METVERIPSSHQGDKHEKLSREDFVSAATQLQIEPCALQAVCLVESTGNGFLASGKARILFEGHIFWRQLKTYGLQPELYAPEHPSILHLKWTAQHYMGGEKEYGRLEEALRIHREAALCSASWGAFQIMGFNYAACGFNSVEDFVSAHQRGLREQLDAFCRFIKTNNLCHYLRNKDWVGFSKRYNGPGYERNQYHTKIELAYQQCLKTQAAG